MLILDSIVFSLLEIRSKYLFLDLQFFQSQMKLLITLEYWRRNADRYILLMRCILFLMLTLSETAHIGFNFLFLSICLQQIMLKQILSVQYPTEFLHEGDLLLT